MESFRPEKNIRKEDPTNQSRRKFLKLMGLASAGVMLGGLKNLGELGDRETDDKKTEDTSSKKEIEYKEVGPEEFVANQIKDCLTLIENKNYKGFLDNPYLVSAIYYSKSALQRMSQKENRSPQEKILSEVYIRITDEIKEGFIKTLEILSNGIADNESTPLENLSYGKNLAENHLDAIDLFAKEGDNVRSFCGGIVVLAENGWTESNELSTSSSKGGNTIIIYNANRKEFYRYAHLQNINVEAGDLVTSGQEIGKVGHTGKNASKDGHGEHLHFEINKYNEDKRENTALSVYQLKNRLDGGSENLLAER